MYPIFGKGIWQGFGHHGFKVIPEVGPIFPVFPDGLVLVCCMGLGVVVLAMEYFSGAKGVVVVLVNGLDLNANKKTKFANGAGCFAAQLVANFKHGAGGIYIDAPTKKAAIGINDYTYVIRIDTYTPSKGIDVQVLEWGKEIFRGDSVKFESRVSGTKRLPAREVACCLGGSIRKSAFSK